MSYVLLTGATGLVGHYLLRDLLLADVRVAVIGRPTRAESVHQRVEAIGHDPIVDDFGPWHGGEHRAYHDPVGIVYLAGSQRRAQIAQFRSRGDQANADLPDHLGLGETLSREQREALGREKHARHP